MPSASIVGEDAGHRKLRALAETIPPYERQPETDKFTENEVKPALMRLGSRKAPGKDRLTTGILKEALPVVCPAMVKVYNRCLDTRVFPAIWKSANVVIPKGHDKDASDPKSYRLISLLPVMGKILERLIDLRLRAHLITASPLSVCQFGFMPGRSAEDAIHAVLDTVRSSAAKYVVVVFLDISGAFGNCWWPSVLAGLRARVTPLNLYKLVQAFLSERRAALGQGAARVEKEVSKGCPQGSVLSPLLWNIIFDDLLSAQTPTGVTVIGYADDGVVVIEADTRPELEHKA